MLLDFALLNCEFVLHILKVLGKEFILLSEFLSRNSQLLILFLSIYEVKSNSAKLLFSLIDLVHVRACLESRFLDKLALVVREAIYLLLQVLNLGGLLLVDMLLLGEVVVQALCVPIHLLDADAHRFLFFLGFCQLDFHISQRLLQLVHFRLCYTQLLDKLLAIHHVSRLYNVYFRWEIGILQKNSKPRSNLH